MFAGSHLENKKIQLRRSSEQDLNDNDTTKMEIGPQLPPHLSHNTSQNEGQDSHQTDKRNDSNLKTIDSESTRTREHNGEVIEDGSVDVQDQEIFGPALPPGFKPKPTAIIGPQRPEPGITDESNTDRETNSEEDEDDANDDTIGPMLPTQKDEDEYLNRRRKEIEARACMKKDELVDKKKPKKAEREEWMVELPPELGKNFGLGPRTFRNRDVDLGDRSVWTDTPSDRAKKHSKSEKKSSEQREKTQKERDTERYVSEHNKRFRADSLLDMHQHDQEKKKKSEGSSEKERKPFDRETDLGIRQMDAAKRKSLVKKSRHLNSKFEHSREGPTYL